jgi:hypothetical protein
MYLATISKQMISPSEIVDIVWHQHLIFTKSYADFCEVLGKKIHHVPSTKNHDEHNKFREAMLHTRKQYQLEFGEEPRDIWHYNTMHDYLELKPSFTNYFLNIFISIALFLLISIPCYHLLKPIYSHIDNPNFGMTYVLLSIPLFFILENYSRSYLKRRMSRFNTTTFTEHFTASELVYLKTGKVADVIHDRVNRLILKNKIKVHNNLLLEVIDRNGIEDAIDYTIISTLGVLDATYYPELLKCLIHKPIFTQIKDTMQKFEQQIKSAVEFKKCFYLNLAIILGFLMLGFTRILTGMAREKEVSFMVFTTLIFTIGSSFYLWRLTRLTSTHVLPEIYKDKFRVEKLPNDNFDWDYLFTGKLALLPAFVSLVYYTENHGGSSGSCGSSCGSNCGSSCGGGCGGCGGGD